MTTALPTPTGVEFDATSRSLLDLMQEDFPLDPRPYRVLGERLGITEADALARLRQAREANVVRQICAIYDTKALGYSSALVAMEVAADRLDHAARVVNAHPGVSHNYKRNHEFNMWFTVAMPPGHDLDAVITRLHHLTGAVSTRPMPTLHLFKIGVTLNMTGERSLTERGAPEYTEERRHVAQGHSLTEEDVAYILATQDDMPSVEEPYQVIAERLGWSVDRVFEHAAHMRQNGHLRRFAAILNHRTAGFRANGMAVWKVAPERIAEFGTFVAGYRNISHCYERPTYEDWPYSVFSMIHHPKVAGVEETAAAIAAETGVEEYRVLYSTVEFKKIRLPYFVPAYEQWESLCEAVANEEARA